MRIAPGILVLSRMVGDEGRIVGEEERFRFGVGWEEGGIEGGDEDGIVGRHGRRDMGIYMLWKEWFVGIRWNVPMAGECALCYCKCPSLGWDDVSGAAWTISTTTTSSRRRQ